MQPIRTILAPTDFSIEATNALVYALNLASRINVKLIILHVDDRIQRRVMGSYEVEDYEGFVKEQFAKIEHDYLYGRQLDYEFKIYRGMTSDLIRKAAHNIQPDLIVLGRKGRNSIYEQKLGSITVSLLDNAPCAILAIPGYCRKLELDNITVASDMVTIFPDHQLYTVDFIAEAMKSKVQIVRIQRAVEELQLETAGRGDDVKEKFDKVFAANTHDYHVVNDKDVVHGLYKFSKHYESDLLVLLKKNRPDKDSIFGPRLTNVMAQKIKMPLLIIPIDN